jgi:hypothetical protein
MHKTLRNTLHINQGESIMQVARYWRMKKQNYRLEGVRYTSGAVSLQSRPTDETPIHKEPVAQTIRA